MSVRELKDELKAGGVHAPAPYPALQTLNP